VFRALSPNCPCDLVLLIDGRVFRVEVTTGHRASNGKMMVPKKDRTRYDILAVLFPDSIVYSTDLPELSNLMDSDSPSQGLNGGAQPAVALQVS
jgi:hypothetical protein